MKDNYDPYGKDWEKELCKISFNGLYDLFGVQRGSLNKKEYVKLIRDDILFRRQQVITNKTIK